MKLRRVALYGCLFLVVLLAGTYFALTRSGLARSLVLDALHRVFRVQVQLGDAELDPLEGTVRLENLRVTPPEGAGPGRRDVLTVPEVVLGVSMNPLAGAGEVRTVSIERPELDIYLGDPAPFDLDALLHIQDAGASSTPPSLRIVDMIVRLHLPTETDVPLRLGPIQLNVLPDAEEAQALMLEGTCPNPLGGAIRIRGTGHIGRKEFRLIAEGNEFELRANGMEAFGEEIARFVRARQLAGRVKPTFWLQYPDAQGEVGGGLRASFSQFQVLPPTFEYLLTHLSGSAALSSDNNGTLDVRIDHSGTDFELEGALRLFNLRGGEEILLRAEARNVAFNEKLQTALSVLPAAREVFQAFRPANGRGDMRLYLHENLPEDAERDVPRIQLDLDVRDTDLRFDGFGEVAPGRAACFPYPLTAGHGRIEVRNDYVTIKGFEAAGVHGGKLSVEGEIDLARDQMDVRATGSRLPLSAALRDAVEKSIRGSGAQIDAFAPQGEADVDFRIWQRGGMAEPSFEATIRPLGASACWQVFPYRVDNIVGSIRLVPEEIRFHLIGSRHTAGGVRRMETRARLLHWDDAARSSNELSVHAEDAVLSPELRAALAHLDPGFGEQWDLFSPAGRMNLEFLTWRAPQEELSFDLRADILDGTATFDPFPVALRQIRGPLVLHGDGGHTRVDVLGLSGRGLEARLLFQGLLSFDRATAAPVADLRVVAKGVRLNEELEQVLAERQMVTRELWRLAKASGTVDTLLNIQRTPEDSDYRQQLTVDLRQVTSRADVLPDVLTRVSGEVRIDEKRVIHMRELEGWVGESRVRCNNGRIWYEPDATFLELDLSAERYPVDDRLANLLDGAVKAAYLERRARGLATVEGLAMTLKVPKVPPPGVDGLGLSGRFHGAQIRTEGLAMDAGTRVSDINGYVVLEQGWFDHQGGRVDGELAGVDFVAFGQQFTDARGPFVGTHLGVTVPRGRVGLHKGTLVHPADETGSDGRPMIRFDANERRRFETTFALVDVDVESMTAALQTSQRYRGLLSGSVHLGLDAVDPSTVEITADLGVHDGNLGDAPVFRSIYAMLRPDKRPNFRGGILQVDGRDRVLHINRLFLSSPIVEVEGEGTLRYDGYLALHLEFPNLFPEASPLTVLPGVYRFLANSLVSYDIVGYVGNTRTGARFVPLERVQELKLGPLPGRIVELPPVFQ